MGGGISECWLGLAGLDLSGLAGWEACLCVIIQAVGWLLAWLLSANMICSDRRREKKKT